MARTINETRHAMLASEVTIPVANDTAQIGLGSGARTSREQNVLEMKRLTTSPEEDVLHLRLPCA